LHARKAVRAQRRHRVSVRVQELLDLVVKDYGDERRKVPEGMYEALNYALGHLRAVEDVASTQLDELCREWRRRGVRWQKDAAGAVTERPAYRVRRLTPSTCNRYMAILRRGYTLAKVKLGLIHPTLTFPGFTEPKNPRPIPPDILTAIFEALDARDDEGRRLEPEARVKVPPLPRGRGAPQGTDAPHARGAVHSATGTMRWTDEDTKQGRPHIVTYTGEARE